MSISASTLLEHIITLHSFTVPAELQEYIQFIHLYRPVRFMCSAINTFQVYNTIGIVHLTGNVNNKLHS